MNDTPVTITLEVARGMVAKGAALLDRFAPNWAIALDTDTLDLRYSNSCVLGQLDGEDDIAARKLWPWRTAGTRDRLMEEHGFISGAKFRAVRDAEHRILQEAWIEAIADRLVTGGAKEPEAAQVQGACCVEAATPNGQTLSVNERD